MISIVIPAYQEGEAIVDQLHQLFVEQHPREVLIIDASDRAIARANQNGRDRFTSSALVAVTMSMATAGYRRLVS